MHKGYAITRIRTFYMRKVKYTAQNIRERLSLILSEFPVLDVRCAAGRRAAIPPPLLQYRPCSSAAAPRARSLCARARALDTSASLFHFLFFSLSLFFVVADFAALFGC